MPLDQLSVVISRAANEGVPVASIARILQRPFDEISDNLRASLACGQITQMPKADWPPGGKWTDRLPTIPRSLNADDIEFHVKHAFRLTKLEAGFMMVLLTHDCADKERLHSVIEQQRMSRQMRPDKQETTDPKMVDVMICKLRKKLKTADETLIIQTSWGKGYFFEPDIKQRIFGLIGVHDGPSDRGEPKAQ